jgi:hypothetical protein
VGEKGREMNRFYRVPYRWLPSTFFRNIWSILEDLFWYGPKNVLRWIPVIWLDEDDDWSFLAEIMEYKLSRMAKGFEEWGHHVGSKKDARRMRICALLLKRLSEDKYSDNASKGYRYGSKAWADEWKNVTAQDEELLFTIMHKHWREWWN